MTDDFIHEAVDGGFPGVTGVVVGLSGVDRHACVAVSHDDRLVAVCGQERASRVRGAGFNDSGLPDEALNVTLERLGLSRSDVDQFVLAESSPENSHVRFECIGTHRALACASYSTSPFGAAVVAVCDEASPKVSIWEGTGTSIAPIFFTWEGPGWVELYARCARPFGFPTDPDNQRFEALARLLPDCRDDRLATLITGDDTSVTAHETLETVLAQQLTGDRLSQAASAASVQARVAELFVAFLRRLKARTRHDRICLAGSFFHHSSVNTAVKRSGIFTDVFIPVDPGRGGRAVGAALNAMKAAPVAVSPFLGPAYTDVETKETLDNCKLQYALESEEGSIAAAVKALCSGHLVGWFDGPMEWGQRTLGARSILANPLSPHVLENLNRFLKRRERWRGYALSALAESVDDHFDGPSTAPYMECDYRPRDPNLLRHVLPSPTAAVRVQTVGADGPPRLRRLLEAFRLATGVPFVVNTSFNGFHEPIVCSPRDAVRVFYGSGLDVLVMNRFLLAK